MDPRAPVLTEQVDEHVVLITINRPEVMNALDRSAHLALSQALADFEADENQRVAVLTGAGGRAFCAGGDLKEMAQHAAGGGTAFEARRVEDMAATELELGAKPVIAAIDGYCVANGLELALACDIRLATAGSMFGLPEVSRGMLAGPGLVTLRTRVPLGEALLLHLTGDVMTAERAHALGLVQALADDRATMIEQALAVARRIASHDPQVVATIRRIVCGRDADVDVRVRRQIDDESTAVAASDTVRRAVTSFAQTAPPQGDPS